MTGADPYALDAAYYDLIHAGHREDIGLWQSFAMRTNAPVLEVGCGTGRIAVELALAGVAVTGVDPSAAMLERARARADEAGAELTLVEGTLGEAALDGDQFGFVLLPADVFLYCDDGEAQRELLAEAARLLRFDGLLAIDVAGPALGLDPGSNGQPVLVYAGEGPDGGTLDAWHVHEDDLAEQTRWLRVTYDRVGADGIVRRQQSEHRLRYVHRFELEYLLHFAGLAVVDVYGDYDLGPLTNDSERMIVTARRLQG